MEELSYPTPPSRVNGSNLSNAQWIKGLRGNKREQNASLSVLRSELMSKLRVAFARSYGIDDTFFEDVVQEASLRILERLDQFEGRSRFITWAAAITVRIAMTKLRRKYWQDVSLDSLLGNQSGENIVLNDATADGSQSDMEQEIIDRLHTVIATDLSSKQRTAVQLELAGVPIDEIAGHLSSTRNAVYKLTHDARKRLKQSLSAAGITASDIESAFSR